MFNIGAIKRRQGPEKLAPKPNTVLLPSMWKQFEKLFFLAFFPILEIRRGGGGL